MSGRAWLLAVAMALPAWCSAATIHVGGDAPIQSIREASLVAQDGDTVLVRAGRYPGDVAVWKQNRLVVRAEGGPVIIDAAGKSALGQGIFVTSGRDVTIEGLEFVNAAVADRNGAGIRMNGGSLHVIGCTFRNNENGILTADGDDATLVIERSQFIGNGFASSGGYAHGLYVGHIRLLRVTGSYFSRTQVGHLVKSRAAETRLLYNRITSEATGTASYEVDLPDGGLAILVGNLIEQSAHPSNPTVISYGAEDPSTWPDRRLMVVHNTLVNRFPGACRWVVAAASAQVTVSNNLLNGQCGLSVPVGSRVDNNPRAVDADFVDAAAFEFTLRASSALAGRACCRPALPDKDLMPRAQYLHPAAIAPLTGPPIDPGAMQRLQR